MLSRKPFSGFAILAFLVAIGGMAHAMPLTHLPPHIANVPSQGTGPLVLTQAEPRISGLEEEIRRLNGLVEELNFQMLQMQDQMRRMQEDNEFRFQQLEGNNSGASAPEQRSELAEPERPADNIPATVARPSSEPSDALPGVEIVAGLETLPPGEPPRTLGSITFDENGNVVATNSGGQLIDPHQGLNNDHTIVAALPPTDNPDEAYRNSYAFILSGDYRMAEAGFRQYLERFPDDEKSPDANFWLGEAVLAQERHREAAEIFLQANRAYPNSSKAPEMLLKLGVALAAMNQRDVACATFVEIGHRYPDVSSALRERIERERALAAC